MQPQGHLQVVVAPRRPRPRSAGRARRAALAARPRRARRVGARARGAVLPPRPRARAARPPRAAATPTAVGFGGGQAVLVRDDVLDRRQRAAQRRRRARLLSSPWTRASRRHTVAARARRCVCMHGFTDTWRTWELVLPALEREHDVLAPTLPGHAGGRRSQASSTAPRSPTRSSARWTKPGFATAHIAGNSLGGYLALQLAARGRARVGRRARAGRRLGDGGRRRSASTPEYFADAARGARRPGRAHADAIVSTPEGRRQATQSFATNFEHIPAELLAHMMRGVAACTVRGRCSSTRCARGYELDAERIDVPGAHRVGHRRPVARVAVGGGALPRGVAAARRLGRARRDRPLPPARRAARDGAADPGLHRALAGPDGKTRRAAMRRPDDDRILAGIHQGRLPRLPRLPNAWPDGEFPLWFRGTSPLAASTSARPISTVTQDRTTPFPRFAQPSSRLPGWEGQVPKFHPHG